MSVTGRSRILRKQRSAWWQVGYARWRSRRARVSELALCAVRCGSDALGTMTGSATRARSRLYVAVVHPWTHVAQFAGDTAQERARGRLLFVGAMDRNENCEAVLYFYTMFSLSSGAIVRLSSCGSWVRIHTACGASWS